MKHLSILLTLILLTGCSTIRNTFVTPEPPLKESEIPYQLKPGAYEGINGERYLISSESPRWSVSEAFLYDTVSNAKPDEQESVWVKYLRYFVLILAGIFISSIILLLWKFFKR